MIVRSPRTLSETQKKRSFERRVFALQGILLCVCLIILSRLIELQLVKGSEYRAIAQSQQYGGVVLPAKRGEILSRNSKTDETSIFATNTTLDLLYIDPLIVTEKHAEIADQLAGILLTPEMNDLCRQGDGGCPPELVSLYRDAFDPIRKAIVRYREGGASSSAGSEESYAIMAALTGSLLNQAIVPIPDITEMRRQFAREIEDRIRRKTVTFVPLLYGANKEQQSGLSALSIPGVYINEAQSLVYANPDLIDQANIGTYAHALSPILRTDQSVLRLHMSRRPLRYVPIMGRLPPRISQKIRDVKRQSAEETDRRRLAAAEEHRKKDRPVLSDPYRGVALLSQHWRYYPDMKIASHVTGFINALSEPQYGIERTFDYLLRGQEGLIASVSDPFGGQIISNDQKFIDPRDGASIVLTIDRFVQSFVEDRLATMVSKVDAESGQAIIMDPFTGQIIAMANAPLFDNNTYASVYEKEPIMIPPGKEQGIVVEVYNPETNARVLKAYLTDLSPEGRAGLSPELQKKLADIEKLYDLKTVTRSYLYLGDNNRREIFPTEHSGVWLKYKNNIGVGSYVNRTIQEIYEPGSVMKAVTMAIAIDQGELSPSDEYDDTGPVKVDEEHTIKNALGSYYGKVTMVDCLNWSINTCLTSVSTRLGAKLFHSALADFGFGIATGIELDSEQPGELKPWKPTKQWSNALLATSSFGQGVSATPLQMITSFAALANGGRLLKPTIIDEIRNSNGIVDKKEPEVVRQVIKPETAATITAMLVNSAANGFARAGKVKGHRMAGKTGTSQIAGPGGKYETGTGSTIATYAGFAPPDHPRFVMLVKLDRPKKDDFGSKSAAPLFKEIAQFLFEYYGIPPDEKY